MHPAFLKVTKSKTMQLLPPKEYIAIFKSQKLVIRTQMSEVKEPKTKLSFSDQNLSGFFGRSRCHCRC